MKVENNKLIDPEGLRKISFEATPNVSGQFGNGMPDTIVIHYSAGSSLNSTVNWLTNPAAEASAHLVVGKNGDIVQLAPFNVRTWHAGRSTWKGRDGLNQYSIGIEIDNAGILTQTPEGFFTSYKKKVDGENVVLAKHKLDTEIRGWEAYTEIQIEVVEEICRALKVAYNITEIVGHDDIAPTRKRDPGPAFPMVTLQNKILYGRNVDLPDEEEDLTDLRAVVMADNLNVRLKPTANAALVSNPLGMGTRLQVIKTEGNWSYVKPEIEGWVSNRWIKRL